MSYLEKVLKMGKEIVEPGNPQVHHVGIFHDDWCGIFKGKPCDYDPDVRDITHYEGAANANFDG